MAQLVCLPGGRDALADQGQEERPRKGGVPSLYFVSQLEIRLRCNFLWERTPSAEHVGTGLRQRSGRPQILELRGGLEGEGRWDHARHGNPTGSNF